MSSTTHTTVFISSLRMTGKAELLNSAHALTFCCMNNPLPKNHIFINNTIEELMGYFENIKNRHNYDR